MLETLTSALAGLFGRPPSPVEEEDDIVRDYYASRKKDQLERTGVITYVACNSAEIDHSYVFPLETDRFRIGDRVVFKVCHSFGNVEIREVRRAGQDDRNVDGKVVSIENGLCRVSGGYEFDMSSVIADFKPMVGDYVSLEGRFAEGCCMVERISPKSSRFVTGLITEYDKTSETGFIAGEIFFTKSDCVGFTPAVRSSVFCTALECSDHPYRAIGITLLYKNSRKKVEISIMPFFKLKLGESKYVDLKVTNCSKDSLEVGHVELFSMDDVRMVSEPENQILPGGVATYTILCLGKKPGNTSATLNWTFNHIKIRRTIRYETIDETSLKNKIRLTLPGRNKFTIPKYVNVKMKVYALPSGLVDVVVREDLAAMQKVMEMHPCLIPELNKDNYVDKMHTLLFLEEAKCVNDVKLLTKDFCLYPKDDTVYLVYEADSPYSNLMPGDSVIVSKPWDAEKRYEGKIWDVLPSQIILKLHDEFMNDYRQGACYTVEFILNRTPMRKRHFAVDAVYKYDLLRRVFPTVLTSDAFEPPCVKIWYNSLLNGEQKRAVESILSQKNKTYPYIICGPPGTGKTVTVVELILQLCQDPLSRLMVVAPTNSAIDLIGVKLLEAGLTKEDLIRLCSYSPFRLGSISSSLIDASYVPSLFEEIPNKEPVPIVTRNNIGVHKVTLGTMQCIGTLSAIGFPGGYFTHVIVDEAGQATEPETLIPLSFLDKENAQFILAGDPNQLGPVVMSRLSRMFGFKDSFLARLSRMKPYSKDIEKHPDTLGYDRRIMTQLVINYRALPKLVKMTSDIFYQGELKPYLNDESIEADLLRKITLENVHLVNKSLVFIDVEGVEEQVKDSWSYFNRAEIAKILLLLNELYEVVTPDQIGIITPYALQSKMISKRLESLNVYSPKVGSVEEFQGAERDVMIFSIVRSSRDISRGLPEFITERNKMNVALSRARVLNIIVGNKQYVSCNQLWQTICKYCE
ncbi:probable RNA helicase armi [Cimex lectularius]|uniref:RNA helicase n=1 Tax=Cimex lectularius TaxID=79782 RepID=A0A8I6RSH0_CIMLE|nr:probable RNA helicase armi [Cimex lectularius]XP_014250680.1 probable RNA helicase armi [Cimex lectularius]